MCAGVHAERSAQRQWCMFTEKHIDVKVQIDLQSLTALHVYVTEIFARNSVDAECWPIFACSKIFAMGFLLGFVDGEVIVSVRLEGRDGRAHSRSECPVL